MAKHKKKLAPTFLVWPTDNDYENIPMYRVLELAAESIVGLTVNIRHCRQMKYNPNIEKAEKEGLILRKRRPYGGISFSRVGGKKRTCFFLTLKGEAWLRNYFKRK